MVAVSEKILKKSAEEHNKRNPGYVSLINCYQGLSIYVSQPVVNRSLCFMDAFIKILQQRSHSVKMESETIVIIGEERIQVSLRERTSRQKVESKHGWNSTRDVPNGRLSFKANIGHGKYWNDGKTTIEQQLPVILQKLEETAELMRIEEIGRQERQRERELQEKLRREREALEDKELERMRALMSQAIRWHRVTMLRTYIADIAKIRVGTPHIDSNDEAWIKWATDKADWFDPSINKEDELLKDVNKSTLTMKRHTDSYYYSYQDNHLPEEKNFWSKHWWNK